MVMTMAKPATTNTPIEKMCESFPRMHQKKSTGIWTHDDNPRFDCYENENGVIGINPWTGRSVEDVLKMGNPPLTFADLYPHDDEHPYIPSRDREKPLDILTLAEYYRLPWKYLYALGYRDGYPFKSSNGYRTRCVKLGGYCNPDGTDYSKKRLRLSLDGKNRFRWDANTPGETIPCGLHRLSEAVEKGYLFIGEGESDAATMWFHGFPYLGISGAGCYKNLDVSLVLNVPRIYILEEPDQTAKNEQGQGFYADVRQHLRDNGYTGDIFSIRWKLSTNYKDPSSVHKSIYRSVEQDESIPDEMAGDEVKKRFADVVAKALRLAIPEGNTSLALTEIEQDDELQTQEPPPLPATDDERLTWLKEMGRVSHKILSPTHKLVLMVLMLHSPVFNLKSEAWWRVDADFLAEQADMPKEKFLACLSYLTKNVHLFTKRHEYQWYKEQGESKVNTVLYIQPAGITWVTYPSTWRLVGNGPS